jgi:chromosome segregation ATPase
MPRQSSITAEAVADAAERLIARGQPVTNQGVLAILGEGSMSTIVPLVRAWKTEQKEREALAQVYVPETISRLAHELAGRIWRDAQREASLATEALGREMKTLRQDYAAARAELEENLNQAEQQRLAAEQARHAAEGETVKIREAHEDLSLAHVRATERIEALQEKIADLQAALAKAEARAERAEERLAALAKGAAG